MDNSSAINQAIELICGAHHIVALTGAGISTEAGIPDFRGPQGMWQDAALMAQLSASGFHRDPAGFYQAGFKLIGNIGYAQPTPAHRLLAQLEELGRLDAVITQNIDGLHQAAGSRTVYELHGTYRTGHCTRCRAKYEMAAFYEEIKSGRLRVPLCSRCRGTIKPDIVLFEDLLPMDAWEASHRAAGRCDLMLVLGSSLVVYPAAELPQVALDRGAALVIVNLEDTSYDESANATVRAKLGDFACAVLDRLGPLRH